MIIYVVSQVLIRTVGYSQSKSGQHIMKHIILGINSRRQKGSIVEICVIPAHLSLCSNKGAKKAAKKVTGWKLKQMRLVVQGKKILHQQSQWHRG